MAKYGVVFSGGLDSTVLLYDLVHKYGADEVVAIGIDFGQQKVEEDAQGLSFANNLIERKLMTSVPEKLGVKHHIVDMKALGFVLDFMKARIAKYGKRRNGKSLSLFPGRNFILAFVAASVAETYGCDEVCMGFPKTDFVRLEDGSTLGSYTSSQYFLDELNKLVDLSSDLIIKFTTPLNHLSKAGEIKLGEELGVNFVEDVWTCLHPKKDSEGNWIQCGVCKPCIRNRASFLMTDVHDPFTYDSNNYKVNERLYTQLKLAGDAVEILDALGVVEHETK
jgi:queuosine biosynthesis protein QueC